MVQIPKDAFESSRDESISPSSSPSSQEITVLVTGFAPFKGNLTNPSYTIANSLPTHLPPLPSHPSAPTINLLIHPTPIRVSYAFVRALIPTLYTSSPNISHPSSSSSAKIDLVLHIGMAAGRSFYTLETLAHRDGYKLRDEDGKIDEEGSSGEGGRGTWEKEGCPAILGTSLDCGEVWRLWKDFVPNVDIRPSDDAGHYLCDFIYYASLAHFYKSPASTTRKTSSASVVSSTAPTDTASSAHTSNTPSANQQFKVKGEQGSELDSSASKEQQRPVLFLHVPGESSSSDIARGREVAIGIIRGMVQSFTSRR